MWIFNIFLLKLTSVIIVFKTKMINIMSCSLLTRLTGIFFLFFIFIFLFFSFISSIYLLISISYYAVILLLFFFNLMCLIIILAALNISIIMFMTDIILTIFTLTLLIFFTFDSLQSLQNICWCLCECIKLSYKLVMKLKLFPS